MQGSRSPDFLTAHDIAIPIPRGCGADTGGIRTRIRLGDAERLQAQGTRGNAGQVVGFLFRRAMSEQRTHNVHLGVAGRRIATGTMDLFEYNGRLHDAGSAAAVFLRNQCGQITGPGHGSHKGGRIGFFLIHLPPVYIREIGTQLPDAPAQILVQVSQVRHSTSC